VGASPCHVIDLSRAGSRLELAQRIERDDFVAVVPKTRAFSGHRLWVDAQTGMVRQYATLDRGRVELTAEVVETQLVNGFPLPALVKLSGIGGTFSARVTEATVNQGTPEELTEFRPPPNWLVRDQTLTIDQARERLKAEPDDANLHYTLGELHRRRGRQDEAAEEFRRAAELAPESPTPLIALAQTLQIGRQHDDANEAVVEALRQAVALAGDEARYLRTRLADALRRAGKIDEAIVEYREMMAKEPSLSHSIAGSLGTALASKGDFEGAYRAAADIPVATLAMWGGAGGGGGIVEWAEKSNHLDDLLAKAEKAVAAEPESGQASLLLARVLQAQGRKAEAIEALKAVPLATYRRSLWWGMSAVLSVATELGEEEFAARARRAAIRQALESGQTWSIHALFSGEGSADAAISDFTSEAAAAWTEAADAQSRAAMLDSVSVAASRLHERAGERETAPTAEPEEMSPAECVIAGVLESARAERADEREAQEAGRLRAHAYFARALTEWPDDAALWASVGNLHWWFEDWEAAIEAYSKAAASDPDQIEYPARVAFALIRAGEHRTGDVCGQPLEIGRKAIEPWPDEWVAKAFFATLQMNCGQFEPARDALVAVYASPDVQPAYHRTSVGRLLARCHERLGELEQAETILKRDVAESQEWQQIEAYRRLMQFYARNGRRADAYAAAKAFYLNSDDDWKRDQAIAEAERAFEDDAEAGKALAATFEADLAAHPGDVDTLRFAAAVYQHMDLVKEALPLLREAAEKANDADVWVQLADVAQRTDDGALAVEALRRALDLKPDDVELRRRYARAAAAQGDTAAAKVLADALRAEAGDSRDAWREVAELYLTAQSWDDALAAAERVLALTPETDEPARMRAEVLAARAYAGKRDDHEARLRLIRILARAQDPTLLREAADALVNLYVLREERHQAIATLNDLRLRTQDHSLRRWIDQRLKEIAGEEEPPPGGAEAEDILFLD